MLRRVPILLGYFARVSRASTSSVFRSAKGTVVSFLFVSEYTIQPPPSILANRKQVRVRSGRSRSAHPNELATGGPNAPYPGAKPRRLKLRVSSATPAQRHPIAPPALEDSASAPPEKDGVPGD